MARLIAINDAPLSAEDEQKENARLQGLLDDPDVIEAHPEYQAFIASEAVLQQEFTPVEGRENPFLHMGLHLAIHEQVGTDRPAGIRAIHERLTRRSGSAHEAEHHMIEILATALWEAQRAGQAPDEATYLERLQRL